jgi:predicted RNA-binding Zn-ribbon protein involved in translation (DUF1610 family)
MAQQHKVCTSCGYTGNALFQVSRLRNVKCPKCGQATMAKLRSAEGQMVLQQKVGQPRTWADVSEIAFK